MRATLITDAYLRLEIGRADALIVEAVQYGKAGHGIKMAVPYRPRISPGGFAVYRPKVIGVTGIDQPDYAALTDAFWAGVDSHGPAAAAWTAHLDQTL